MTSTIENRYNPIDVSAPGETLLETLETIGMSQVELAKRMGRPVKTINEIIQKKTAITAETALQLEQVLHIPASFWLKREQRYRESLAHLAEEHRLKQWVWWLKDIPIQTMMRQGWIPTRTERTQQVLEALKFFSVASPEVWRAIWESKLAAYRKTSVLRRNFGAVAAWLGQGELEAQKIECRPYDARTFHDTLLQIRALTAEPANFSQIELAHLCAKAGVAVVFVQELSNTGIWGSTQWLTSVKALIQLSQRYTTLDQLWLAFFHEAGHILRHGKRELFLEMNEKVRVEEENEAHTLASNILIPPTQWRQFITRGSYRTQADIKEFARNIGIAPGIIVGRLQQEKLLPYDHFNELKHYLTWGNEESNDVVIDQANYGFA